MYNQHEVKFDIRTGNRLRYGVPSSEVSFHSETVACEVRRVPSFLDVRQAIDSLLTEAEHFVLSGNYVEAKRRCDVVRSQPESFHLPMDGLRLGAMFNHMSR